MSWDRPMYDENGNRVWLDPSNLPQGSLKKSTDKKRFRRSQSQINRSELNTTRLEGQAWYKNLQKGDK